MKGINYLQMLEEAKTSAEVMDIVTKADEALNHAVSASHEYSDWTDDELSEYIDMLRKVEDYYSEHFEEFHTPREIEELDEIVR